MSKSATYAPNFRGDVVFLFVRRSARGCAASSSAPPSSLRSSVDSSGLVRLVVLCLVRFPLGESVYSSPSSPPPARFRFTDLETFGTTGRFASGRGSNVAAPFFRWRSDWCPGAGVVENSPLALAEAAFARARARGIGASNGLGDRARRGPVRSALVSLSGLAFQMSGGVLLAFLVAGTSLGGEVCSSSRDRFLPLPLGSEDASGGGGGSCKSAAGTGCSSTNFIGEDDGSNVDGSEGQTGDNATDSDTATGDISRVGADGENTTIGRLMPLSC